jgi:uncharacterized membrane protein
LPNAERIPVAYASILPRRIVLWAAIAIVASGIFLRFYRLDHHLFWQDEVYVVYRVSGYTEHDLGRELARGQTYRLADLEKYLHPARHNRGLWAVIRTAWEYPHIPPLYESLLWCWVKIFGDSITAIRSLSVFISLFAFPLVIWLCWEIFRSFKVGWIAAILLAVSPYQVMFAQETRNYSLWCVAILFSSAALLRAARVGNAKAWMLYAGSLVFGLYSHPFTLFVATAHSIFVLLFDRKSIRKMLLSYLGALFLFSPQIFLMVRHFERIVDAQQWVTHSDSLGQLWFRFFWGLSRLFFHYGTVEGHLNHFRMKLFSWNVLHVYLFLIAAFTVTVIVFLWRKASQKQAAFITLILLVNWLALLLPDLLFGGLRASMARYLMASLLMIQLAISFFIYSCMNSQVRAVKMLGAFVLSMLVLMGTVSSLWCAKSSEAHFSPSENIYREIAGYLDAHQGSLVIITEKGRTRFRKIFTTYYYLKDRKNTFFTRISKAKPLVFDHERYPKSLLAVFIEEGAQDSTKKWVEGPGIYNVEPVGPDRWRREMNRVYEIVKR